MSKNNKNFLELFFFKNLISTQFYNLDSIKKEITFVINL